VEGHPAALHDHALGQHAVALHRARLMVPVDEAIAEDAAAKSWQHFLEAANLGHDPIRRLPC
jgi:hypothetical protein